MGRGRTGRADANLLAISDLHLGHDLKQGAELPPGDIPSVDLPLAAFLDHHRTNRRGGAPWRLVIVGDMVDFIAITLTPAAREEVPFAVSENERRYGLKPEPAKAEWKLRRVLVRHQLFFRALARFVAGGNEVVVLCGNHDPEWVWPAVQRVLREGLADLASLDRSGEEGRAFMARVRCRDWFYLEPGRFYAEHGHCYDEFAIGEDHFPGAVRRIGAALPLTLREPVSTLAQRYFANRHATLDMNEVERWSFMDFVRWGVRSGRFARTLLDYFAMCGRVLSFSVRASLHASLQSIGGWKNAQEDRRVVRLRAAGADQEEPARELAALMRPPAERSVVATVRMLYFDRVLLGAGVMACALVGAILSGPAVLRGGFVLGAVAVGAVLNGWLARARLVDSHPKLLAAAHRVAVLFRVPVVVMGHTHRPIVQSVGDGARYINLGTWLAPERDGGQAGFPYVVVEADGPALRRWPLGSAAVSTEVA